MISSEFSMMAGVTKENIDWPMILKTVVLFAQYFELAHKVAEDLNENLVIGCHPDGRNIFHLLISSIMCRFRI